MLSGRVGYLNITRRQVAAKAEVANGTVSYHFPTMQKLQDAVIKRAIDLRLLPIIAQGLIARNWHALRLPQELKDAAAQYLAA